MAPPELGRDLVGQRAGGLAVQLVVHLRGVFVQVVGGVRSALIRRSFLETVDEVDIERSIAALRRPVLVMHSPVDQVVGIEHASRIFVASRHPKSFVSLDTADHLLTDVEDANYASAMVAAWASRFLPPLAISDELLREGLQVVADALKAAA